MATVDLTPGNLIALAVFGFFTGGGAELSKYFIKKFFLPRIKDFHSNVKRNLNYSRHYSSENAGQQA